MSTPQTGDIIRIHYTGRFPDGTVFDSSEGREPLEFTHGVGQVIPGLDRHVAQMRVGDKSTVTIPAADAYGPHHDEAVQVMSRNFVPAGIPLELGTQLQARGPDGSLVTITVIDMDDETITVDANHPMAGKDLIFDVELVEVRAQA
ncbi:MULTISPECIES: peptidylprolyl isomerase [unclassified Devosia]|uniref:FKBP-type peptidyl-prolyl cis-trans isomerase n=1 Tax=unclassified Devosia TaxID=196773 RepID=UPI0015F826EE|nr:MULTISPECIES: peptidylprolyl isomerase [unclassified Devosia]MBJ6989000.1 peptidylprolyl isomerase [Devosia sp. MC521]MBJ7579372.1 peptidylprolyl isomerase [Devosia sp. MC532]QMW62959.1 peptidylprolyl isomerase [Devosia sp. MC521]